MKITGIKQQVKRSDRYSIYVDGKYSFSLSEGDLIKSALRKDQEVNEAELGQFKDDSRLSKLYEKTLNLLSYRQRSEWELRDYLRRKKQSKEDIEIILSKLSENGYVDDQKFAQSWVETRRLLKPMSKKRLRLELRQKRIADTFIEKGSLVIDIDTTIPSEWHEHHKQVAEKLGPSVMDECLDLGNMDDDSFQRQLATELLH